MFLKIEVRSILRSLVWLYILIRLESEDLYRVLDGGLKLGLVMDELATGDLFGVTTPEH